MESGEGVRAAEHDARSFDQWYENMAASPVRDAIVAGALGLPPEVRSSSLLPGQGIAEVVDALRMPEGGLLADVGCGRGGYGIEVARRAGVRLLGVDFSAVALEQARSAGDRLLPEGRSEFRAGTLAATGLPDGAADAVMCVDAVQFADPPLAALREFRRVLASGGRLAVSCWEAVDPSDERVLPRLRAVRLRRDLAAAGFADVRVRDRPEWRAIERRMWEDALAATADADPAVRSLQSEGRRVLETFDLVRRVFATAAAP